MRTIEIHENDLFYRRIFLPFYAEKQVKEGDQIHFGDSVARSINFDRIHAIKLNRGAIEKLKVKQGDVLNKDEFLTNGFGLFSRRIRVPEAGRVIAITHNKIYLESAPKYTEIRSGFTGRVSSISADSIEIEIFGDSIQGFWGNNQSSIGLLKLPDRTFLAGENTIFAIEDTITKEELSDLLNDDSAGIILAGISAALASRIVRSSKAVILVSGFGKSEFLAPIRSILKKNENQMAIVNACLLDPQRGLFPEIIFPKVAGTLTNTQDRAVHKNAVQVCAITSKDRYGIMLKRSRDRIKLASGITDYAIEVLYDNGEQEIVPRSHVIRLK